MRHGIATTKAAICAVLLMAALAHPARAASAPKVGTKCDLKGAVLTVGTVTRVCAVVKVGGKSVLRWQPRPTPTTVTAASVVPVSAPAKAPVSLKDAVEIAVQVLADSGIRVSDTVDIADEISRTRVHCGWLEKGGFTGSNGQFFPYTPKDLAGEMPLKEPRLSSFAVGVHLYCSPANAAAVQSEINRM